MATKLDWGGFLREAGRGLSQYGAYKQQQADEKAALEREDRLLAEDRAWRQAEADRVAQLNFENQLALYDYKDPMEGELGPASDLNFSMPYSGTPISVPGAVPGQPQWPVDFGGLGLSAPTQPMRQSAREKYVDQQLEARRLAASGAGADPTAGMVDFTMPSYVPGIGGQTFKVSPGSVGGLYSDALDYVTEDFPLPDGTVIKIHPSQRELMRREYYPGPAAMTPGVELGRDKFEASQAKAARDDLVRRLAGERRTAAMTVRVGNTSVPEAFTYGSGGGMLSDRDMREGPLGSNAYSLVERYADKYADDVAAGTISPEQAYEYVMTGVMNDPEFVTKLPEGLTIDTMGTPDPSDDVFVEDLKWPKPDKRRDVEQFKMDVMEPLIRKMDNPAIGYAALNNMLKARGLTIKDYQTGGAPQQPIPGIPAPARTDTVPDFSEYF